MKATIYKVYCDQAYMMCEQGEGYSLRPWGNDTSYYHGGDDGGEEYELPEGFEVAESRGGTDEIYGPDGMVATLGTGKDGNPVLYHGWSETALRLEQIAA